MSHPQRKRRYRIRRSGRIDLFLARHMHNAPPIHRQIVESELAAGRTVVITDGRYDPFMTFMIRRDNGTL